MTWTLLLPLPLVAGAAPTPPQPPAGPGVDRDSVAVFRATRSGRILPLREIEKKVVPRMKNAQYIGFNLEMPAGIYTLKFLKDGEVIWVDVDGRSGQVLGRTGR